MRRFGTLVLMTLGALCAARPALAIDVGEQAPELAVSEWLQGDPVKISEGIGSRTRLLVFWRTFCEGMGEQLSRLDALAKERKDKAFDVIALTTEPVDIVKPYLVDHKVEFRVGLDQFHAVQDCYARKDDKEMPVAWLIDKQGVVVWKGGLWGCQDIVDQVLSGKFDLEKSKQSAERIEAMWKAYDDQDWDKLAPASEAVLAIEPNNETAFDMRLRCFREKSDHAGYDEYMKADIKKRKDDAGALARDARALLTQPGQTWHFRGWSGFFNFWNRHDSGEDWRDVDLSYQAAKRAVEVSKSSDASALEQYVTVLSTVGLLDEAIEQQKKVVALDAKNDDRAKYLAFLSACLAARKKAQGQAPPPTPPKKK